MITRSSIRTRSSIYSSPSDLPLKKTRASLPLQARLSSFSWILELTYTLRGSTALRLDTIRLLIADDVGIGKTIEAGLIAREMLAGERSLV